MGMLSDGKPYKLDKYTNIRKTFKNFLQVPWVTWWVAAIAEVTEEKTIEFIRQF